MKFALLPLLAVATLLGQSVESGDDPNVNSRYTIESIGFVDAHSYKLSTSALEEMRALIGAKLNTEALNRLVGRIRGELQAHDVKFRLARGGDPDSVKVLLEVDKGKSNIDFSIPQFAYNSKLGWTGIGEASANIGANTLTLGLVSDGDTLIERYTGVQARYDRTSVLSDRIRFAFEFDAYHEEYNQATLLALGNATTSSLGAGAYRSRLNFEPSATFVVLKPLTLTVGLSFEQLQPELTAARPESANAVINTLRYHSHWRESDATKMELDAGYSLRAATKSLASDLGYTRHEGKVRYDYVHDHQSIEVTVVAGAIYGQAPLFERFVLGDSAMLRGWNQFELDPLGGNRVAYGSVTYGYHIMRVFYDTGSVWDQGKTPERKQSVGIGVSGGLGVFQRGAFLLALAFPLRDGRVGPVLIAGMNF
jgi:outer membrane protein assembly factor BamA